MNNIPVVKPGIVAVSRDCFPMALSARRRGAIVEAYRKAGSEAYRKAGGELYECPVTVENETDMLKALEASRAAGVNALIVFLGNFGPETAETLLAKYFDGPVMFVGAAEESGEDLLDGRGDAYCGMLNASYNLSLRGVRAYIPPDPVGTAGEIADAITGFLPIARALIGLSKLKIITFGPRPQDFLACNAPIKRLYDLGVEIEENSELDLYAAFRAHEGDRRIEETARGMAAELGAGNRMPDMLPKLAQYELTLLDWAEAHLGAREYVVFANKCWPAFQTQFGFVPCYVNGRLAACGVPVACETDIYGALSEYIGTCVTQDAVTLLDVNNTVPRDMFEKEIKGKFGYRHGDLFMGFHCGNTAAGKLVSCQMKNQRIMARTLPEEVTRGTLEGDLTPGKVTLYRLQSTADARLAAYVAEGEILPVSTRSFGAAGVFAVPEMARFYRHVLIGGHFPHHGAIAFGSHGRAVFEVLRYLGVSDIGYNRPAGLPYPDENPFG